MEFPFISVIIPALNEEQTIGQTLASLSRVQYPSSKFEIIVVDGGSTDRTQEIVKRFHGIRLLLQKSREGGPTGARNQAALVARGDIVAFIDADCIAPQNWLAVMAKCYIDNKDVVGVGGTLLPLNKSLIADFMHPEHTVPASEGANCSFRRGFLLQIGGFDERIGFGAEDTEFANRALSKGYKLINSPDLIVYHLVNDNLIFFMKRYFGYSSGNLKYRFLKGKLRPPLAFPFVFMGALRKAIKSLIGDGKSDLKKASAFFILSCMRGFVEILGEWWHYSQLKK